MKALTRTRPVDLTGLVFVVLGVGCILEGRRLADTAGSHLLAQQLSPGLYVLVLGSILVAAGAINLITSAKEVPPDDAAGPRSSTRIVAIVAALAGYVVAIERIGYLPASLGFFGVVLFSFGVRSRLQLVLIALGSALAFYFLFVRWFGVVFPRGTLTDLLF